MIDIRWMVHGSSVRLADFQIRDAGILTMSYFVAWWPQGMTLCNISDGLLIRLSRYNGLYNENSFKNAMLFD
jgi:hypothetical protein